MIFVISFCFSTVFCNAQQAEKEIAKNQDRQIELELEMANNDVAGIDLDAEQEYLQVQSQTEQAVGLLRDQIDSEVAVSMEQSKQDADKQIEAMEKEQHDQARQAMQESEQDAAELEEQAQRIKSEMLKTE